MEVLVLIACLFAVFVSTSAKRDLTCVECTNEPSVEACNTNGTAKFCNTANDPQKNFACQTHWRERYTKGNVVASLTVSRMCKEVDACKNNWNNNPADCRTIDPFHRVCRCCCQTDRCSNSMNNIGYCTGTPKTTTAKASDKTTPTQAPETECDEPEPIENGKHNCTAEVMLSEGTKCKYVCNEGYEIKGNDLTTCKRSRDLIHLNFIPSPGICVPKPVCEEPSEPVNGYTTCEEEDPSKYYEGTKCTYQCNRGYTYHGEITTICQKVNNGEKEIAFVPNPGKCLRKVDLSFLLQASVSVDEPDIHKTIVFAREVVEGLTIGLNDVRVSNNYFAQDVHTTLYFNESVDSETVLNKMAFSQIKESTGFYDSITQLYDEVFTKESGSREDAKKIVVIVVNTEIEATKGSLEQVFSSHTNIERVLIGARFNSELPYFEKNLPRKYKAIKIVPSSDKLLFKLDGYDFKGIARHVIDIASQ